ncbi:MAG: four helix bundle protein [Ignavibacterium album]|uniref:four helix bundle protein n=1 Tax=Ignavibacterium album TaxID=591197 RepID=UPI0026F19887|nr:four helix bundle protein [Ignavibacterium album]MCX8104700.1 four helix bundle protein [Ignavibacterium album]
MKTHRDLQVWSDSIDFVTKIYMITNKFPREELFGLTSQMRRAAVSISSNIAEGAARNTKKEFNNFLSFALASASELETQLVISKNLNYLDIESFNMMIEDLNKIQRMIGGLMRTLK